MKSNVINKDLQKIKEAVNADKISISDLLKSSYKLIRMDIIKLIAIVIFLQLISITNILFMELIQKEAFLSGYLFLSSLISLIIGSLVVLIPVVALFEVYDNGQFSLTDVITIAFKKFFKFLWTIILPGLIVLLLFFCFAFLYGLISVFFEIPVSLLYLVFFILLVVLFIWIFVPFYFLEYIVVSTKHYGLAAMKISFKLVKGRKSQLFSYILVISLISLIFVIPSFILMRKSFIAYFYYSIPYSIIGLYWWSYGLLLYKHVVSKIEESKFDSILNDKKGYKHILCKECLAKVNLETKICPRCGSDLLNEDVIK